MLVFRSDKPISIDVNQFLQEQFKGESHKVIVHHVVQSKNREIKVWFKNQLELLKYVITSQSDYITFQGHTFKTNFLWKDQKQKQLGSWKQTTLNLIS